MSIKHDHDSILGASGAVAREREVNPMDDKPRLQVIDGGKEEILARRILKLLMSPGNNRAEIDRLLAILDRRGDLSAVQGGLDGLPDADNKEQDQGDKE